MHHNVLNSRFHLLLSLALIALAMISGCRWLDRSEQPQAPEAPVPVVFVNGEPVYRHEIDALAQRIVAHAPSQMAPGQIERLMPRIRAEARRLAINQKLIEQAIERHQIEVAPQAVTEEIEALQQLHRVHRSSLEDLFEDGEYTSPQLRLEVEQQLKEIRLYEQLLDLPEPTEDQLRGFYQQFKQQLYYETEAVELHHILVAYEDPGVPHPREERNRLHSRADSVRQHLLAEEPFDEVARHYSDGPYANQGGYIGWINRSANLPTEVVDTAFKLDIGEISPIIGSYLGFHVFKITDRRQPRYVPFAEIREIVENDLKKYLIKQRADEVIEQLRAEAEIVKAGAAEASTYEPEVGEAVPSPPADEKAAADKPRSEDAGSSPSQVSVAGGDNPATETQATTTTAQPETAESAPQPTPTVLPSPEPTVQPTPMPPPPPTPSITPTPVPTVEPTPPPTPTPEPTPQPTPPPRPTVEPSPVPTPKPTPQPIPEPSPEPID